MSRLPKLATTKLPQATASKPIVSVPNKLTNTKSTSSLNKGNSLMKKDPKLTSREWPSTSKTVTELPAFGSFNKRVPASTSTEAMKRPIKRLGVPIVQVPAKVQKPSQPVKKAPIKSITAKPAAYDYKARFALLKQTHDALKATHSQMKENHDEILDENETLIASNEKLNSEISVTNKELDNLKDIHEKITTSLQLELFNLQEDYVKLKADADRNEKELKKCEIKLIDHENMKIQLIDKSTRLDCTRADLDEHIILVRQLNSQLYKLDADKRKLHNDIQDLKGNIRVFCRVRPHLHEERHKLLYNVNFLNENSMELSKDRESIEPTGRIRLNKFDFTFDRVFSPGSSQEDIFSELAQLVQSALDGYNVCVFAYGQTGSGKTYTMEGTSNSVGMIPRAIDLIFALFKDLQLLGWTYEIKASFLEIYNENIVDLLNPNNEMTHEIKMADTEGSNVYVTNLTVQDYSCAEELNKYMKIAQRNRAVAATGNNERSSRSHSVSKIMLRGFNSTRNETCTGSLNLIDLAGSERLNSNEKTRLTETKNINKSLANLSNVILALVQRQDHIPYRNSKLTHLLMPCLGGNSKTLMLVNVSPFEECFNETLNSLRFAARVNQCKTGMIKRNKMIQSS